MKVEENILKEELLEKIKAEKEILDTMPVNNEKNIKIYNERIDFLKQEYTEKREALLKEIKTRFNKKTEKEVNNEIENLKNQIENYSEIMEIIDEIKSPYQKSGCESFPGFVPVRRESVAEFLKYGQKESETGRNPCRLHCR